MDLVNEYSSSNDSSSLLSSSSDEESNSVEEEEIRCQFAQAPVVNNFNSNDKTNETRESHGITTFTFIVPQLTDRQVSQCEAAAEEIWFKILYEDNRIGEMCVLDKNFADDLSGESKYHISTSYNITFQNASYMNVQKEYSHFVMQLQRSLKTIKNNMIQQHLGFTGQIKIFKNKDGTCLFIAATLDNNTCQNLAPFVDCVNDALLDGVAPKYDRLSLHMSIGRIAMKQSSNQYNGMSVLSSIQMAFYTSTIMSNLKLRFGTFNITDGRKLITLFHE